MGEHDDAGESALALWLAARGLASRLESRLDSELRAQAGSSAATYAVLCAIRRPEEALSQQALADGLGLNKSSISRRIRDAAMMGLVEVHPSGTSRRENVVTITEAGEEAIALGDALLSRIARDLDPPSARQLAAALAEALRDD